MPVYVKFSAPYRCPHNEGGRLIRLYLDALGPERLMWGSDWPWIRNERGTTYADCRMRFDEWVPSEADRQQILFRTPMRLFGFPASEDEDLSSAYAILQSMRRCVDRREARAARVRSTGLMPVMLGDIEDHAVRVLELFFGIHTGVGG